jgi:hypothetical protein
MFAGMESCDNATHILNGFASQTDPEFKLATGALKPVDHIFGNTLRVAIRAKLGLQPVGKPEGGYGDKLKKRVSLTNAEIRAAFEWCLENNVNVIWTECWNKSKTLRYFVEAAYTEFITRRNQGWDSKVLKMKKAVNDVAVAMYGNAFQVQPQRDRV